MIKETIRTSRKVNGMSDFEFRLWVYLITYVDDYGRGSADPEILKGFLFPRRRGVTEQQIAKTLADLATSGIIHLYDVGGESFLCFPNWSEHQRVRQKLSKFPAPLAADCRNSPQLAADGGLKPNQRQGQGQVEDISSSLRSEDCPDSDVGTTDHASKPKKTAKVFEHESKPYKSALYLDKQICHRLPERKKADEATLQRWAADFDKTNRIDGYVWETISDVIVFSQKNQFWQKNILSGDAFRRNFVKLLAQMGGAEDE